VSAQILPLRHSYLVFQLGGNRYGFEARFLWEAAAGVSFTEIPLNENHLMGVTQLHGKIIPVLDLAGLLGIPLASAQGEFVTAHLPGPPEILVGFQVEAVVGFLKLAGENPLEDPGGRGWIDGEKKFTWLDIEKIIGQQALGLSGKKSTRIKKEGEDA